MRMWWRGRPESRNERVNMTIQLRRATKKDYYYATSDGSGSTVISWGDFCIHTRGVRKSWILGVEREIWRAGRTRRDSSFAMWMAGSLYCTLRETNGRDHDGPG